MSEGGGSVALKLRGETVSECGQSNRCRTNRVFVSERIRDRRGGRDCGGGTGGGGASSSSALASTAAFVGEGEKKASSVCWLTSFFGVAGADRFFEVEAVATGAGGVGGRRGTSRRSISSITPRTRKSSTKPKTGTSRYMKRWASVFTAREKSARRDSPSCPSQPTPPTRPTS